MENPSDPELFSLSIKATRFAGHAFTCRLHKNSSRDTRKVLHILCQQAKERFSFFAIPFHSSESVSTATGCLCMTDNDSVSLHMTKSAPSLYMTSDYLLRKVTTSLSLHNFSFLDSSLSNPTVVAIPYILQHTYLFTIKTLSRHYVSRSCAVSSRLVVWLFAPLLLNSTIIMHSPPIQHILTA